MATPKPPRDAGVPAPPEPFGGATDFEQSMTTLEHFERGVQLSRACRAAWRVAEQRVEILLHDPNFSDELGAVPHAPEQAQDSTG